MKSQEINIGDILKCYVWDKERHYKCRIINKYKDYKATFWADFCFDVEFLEDTENSKITNMGFIAGAFENDK